VTAPNTWYFDDDSGTPIPQTTYPLYSSFDSYPFDGNSFDLNWTNPPQFWNAQVVGFDGRTPNTAFTTYWQNWFDATYDPYSRIMEGTFALDVTDVLDLSFNDKVFVKDSWWLVLELKDFVLGQKNNVRVKLLKLGNLGVNIGGTGPSSGTRYYVQDTVCYGTTLCDACCCKVFSTILYSDGPSLGTSQYLFYDAAGSTPAISGYYSDGTNAYFVDTGVITSSSSCSGCDCGPTGGSTFFPDVCEGTTICQVCCCTAGEIAIYGNGASVELSTRLWADITGTPLTPGRWYRQYPSGNAVQVGNDGVTVVQVAVCSSCVCNPLEDKRSLSVGTSELSSCCIEGVTGGYGVNTVWFDDPDFTLATEFYYDPYFTQPVGPTAGNYVSDGVTLVAVVGGTAGATGGCAAYGTCPNRSVSVDLNQVNTSGTPCDMDTTMYITYDDENYFYAGQGNSTGGIYSDNFPIDYAPESSFQFVTTFSGSGFLNVDVQKDSVSIFSQDVPGPASFNSPTFGPIGATGNYDIYLSYTP
jgi:hypothetical protein